MAASEAALCIVKDNLRAMTLELLSNRVAALSHELALTRRRHKNREKALEETKREVRSSVLTPEHYETLLFVHSQLESCLHFVSSDADGGAITNAAGLSSALRACAEAAGRLVDALHER